VPLSNTDLAEHLARAGAVAEGHRKRAYDTAAIAALLWEEEAADVVAEGRSLEELERIGPSLARRVRAWIEDDEKPPEPPAERAGFRSFAEARRIVAAAGDAAGVRADLQMHTTYSDGKATVREMWATCEALGYEYIAITDHSAGQRIPRGIDEEAITAQGREIDELNASSEGGPRVLRALEMNLDLDGRGDTDPRVLGGLDLVLGSFHSALRRDEDQTRRYLGALVNPHVDVIGHPRGRKYNLRLGLVADWDEVLEAAAISGKAMETNAYPNRQDLSVQLLEIVRDAGGYVSIGTDAHDPTELRFLDIGVAAALTAGIPRDRILNMMSCAELLDWVAARRAATG